MRRSNCRKAPPQEAASIEAGDQTTTNAEREVVVPIAATAGMAGVSGTGYSSGTASTGAGLGPAVAAMALPKKTEDEDKNADE